MKNAFDSVYMNEKGVLRNKLGITEPEKLEEQAADLSERATVAIASLRESNSAIMIKGWNAQFLKDLHKALLGKVYDWAGEYRKVDIGIEYDHVAYEHWENVPRKVDEVFAYIREKGCFKGMGFAEQVKNLALVFGMLKNLQPFRDGNTRTVLLFTSLLAAKCGMVLDFKALDIEEFRKAQVLARDGNYNRLVMQFATITFEEKDIPDLAMPKVFVAEQKDDLCRLCEEKVRTRPAPKKKEMGR